MGYDLAFRPVDLDVAPRSGVLGLHYVPPLVRHFSMIVFSMIVGSLSAAHQLSIPKSGAPADLVRLPNISAAMTTATLGPSAINPETFTPSDVSRSNQTYRKAGSSRARSRPAVPQHVTVDRGVDGKHEEPEDDLMRAG